MAGAGVPTDEIRTIRMSATVRRASVGLKVAAGLLAVGAIVGSAISATTDLNQFYGGPEVHFPWRVKLSTFLSTAVPSLAWAALVYAAAVALQVAWTRSSRVQPPSPRAGLDSRSTMAPPQVPLDDDQLWKPR